MTAEVTPAVAAVGAPAAQPIERQSGAYRWYVLSLLFLISIVNMMDRTIVPALAEPLKAEFNLSDSQFGFLAGLVYAVSYTACGIPIGLLMDRVNRAKMLACLVFVWGGATMMLGAVTSFLGLIVTRMAVASAESGGSPTSVSLLTDYFPPDKRATAIGAFFSAYGIAAFAAFSLAGWIGATYGWRMAFVIAGAPGIVLGLLAFFTLREPKRGAYDPPVAPTAEKPARAGLFKILKTMVLTKTILYLTIAGILSTIGVAGLGAFTASFFYRVHHLSLPHAGLVTGLVIGGAYTVGSILGGYLSDKASKGSVSGGVYLVAGAMFLAAPFAAGGFLTSNLILAVVLIFTFKMMVGAFYGGTFAAITHASPVAMRGSILSFMNLIMNLLGAGTGPQIAGILSDRFDAAGYADPLRWALVVVSLVLVLSGGMFMLAARSMRVSSPAA